jgi:hypothetical protein
MKRLNVADDVHNYVVVEARRRQETVRPVATPVGNSTTRDFEWWMAPPEDEEG